MVEKAQENLLRKILVTGSSGMLGTAVSEWLSADYDIAGLDKRAGRSAEQVDITARDNTVKSIAGRKPDLVIHAAAWTDVDGCEKEPDKAQKINIKGTENVTVAASKLGIPLIYISTDFVFDGRKKTPYTEDDTPNPLNVYARSKLEGEKRVEKLNKYLILRTSWLFGANGKNFVDTILDEAKKEKNLRVVDDQVGSPTYAKDLAEAIGKLLKSGITRSNIYHVSNSGAVSWFDYAREILKLAGIKSVSLTPIKTKELKRPAGRPAFSVLDNTRFEEATGFAMRPWQEALAEYLNEKR
jgi:dTDP-4-dehydrorhamnose reductase